MSYNTNDQGQANTHIKLPMEGQYFFIDQWQASMTLFFISSINRINITAVAIIYKVLN